MGEDGRGQRLARLGHPGEDGAQGGERQHGGDADGVDEAKDQAGQEDGGPDADAQLGGVVEDAPEQELLGQRGADGGQPNQHRLYPGRSGPRQQRQGRVGRGGRMQVGDGGLRQHQQRQRDRIAHDPVQQVSPQAVRVPAQLLADGSPPAPRDPDEYADGKTGPDEVRAGLQHDEGSGMAPRRQGQEARPERGEEAGELIAGEPE